jgi:23S rRNA (guanine1835-N2)-methyltransferase
VPTATVDGGEGRPGQTAGVMDDVLSVPQGAFSLRRRHHDPTGSLRAWDAADELLLDHLATVAIDDTRWLVVNDGFGALAAAGVAAGRQVTSWSDSCVALGAAADNLARNGLDASRVELLPSTARPDGPIEVVVVKVPKALAHLEDQLRRLRPLLSATSTVVGAGMTRDVHRSTIDAFEHLVGPTPTSRARKKARLLLAQVDLDLVPPTSPFPITWWTPEGVEVTVLANVFATDHLDHGTRLLLDHLPSPDPDATVVDLGCGNGVVAATMARRNQGIDLVCCDESYQAVEAARATVGRVTDRAAFHVTDVLDGIEDRTADVVLVNPPFHAGGARTTAVAQRMFAEAHRVLREGGELRVVANRHLDHHATIRRRFGSVTVVAADPRFSVLSATR